MEELEKLQKRFDRERLLRQKSEQLLEEKSLELFYAKEQVEKKVADVEQAYQEMQETNYKLVSAEEELRQIVEELQSVQEDLEQKINLIDLINEGLEHKIAQRTEELEKQKHNVLSSIHYAKRIQDSFLPSPRHLADNTKDYLIFFRPRDIVSGDFYWFAQKNDNLIIIAADCTGHGVPGALMSMIGANIIDMVVNMCHVTVPNIILNVLHQNIKVILKREKDSVSKDTMEVGICVVNQSKGTIQYAGAKIPLYYFQNGVFHEIKANKIDLGTDDEDFLHFDNHVIDTKKGEVTFYLCSDGFKDQFGEKRNKRFYSKNLKELLYAIHLLDMETQLETIKRVFDDWKGKESQIDDVLILGVKI